MEFTVKLTDAQSRVIIEKSIEDPQEIEVAVMGNEYPVTSCTGRIVSSNEEIYDYDAKYITDTSSDYIPARISEAALEAVRAYAVQIYEILGCRGLSRVDFFVTADEQIIFNEINTLPGFTSISMYPKLWNHMGKSTTALLDELIALAEAAGK